MRRGRGNNELTRKRYSDHLPTEQKITDKASDRIIMI